MGRLEEFFRRAPTTHALIDLLACRTSPQLYKVPYREIVLIPKQRKGKRFGHKKELQRSSHQDIGEPRWLTALQHKRAVIFAKGLGMYKMHVVSSFPFKYPLTWRQQLPN